MRRRGRPSQPAPQTPNPFLRRKPRVWLWILNGAGVLLVLGLGAAIFSPRAGSNLKRADAADNADRAPEADLRAAPPPFIKAAVGAPPAAATPSEQPAPPATKPQILLAAAAAPTVVAPAATASSETPDPEGKHKHKKDKEKENGDAAKGTSNGKPPLDELAADRAKEDAFFQQQDFVPYFSFDFVPEEWQYIHEQPRRFAECTMTVDDLTKAWKAVAVHLKGSAGSFQGPDQKPGLSISMNKFQKAERWNGFLKWHLNNGAQDNSFLNEEFSCEIARAVGVPASRCAHAIVRWQKRDLGLFVFKEAFDRDFLVKFYKNPDGDLYDGGFVADIRPEMVKDQGDRENRENIKQLIAACSEGDVKKRWEKMEKILDIDAYISFLSVESLTCHWDGYNFNKNNYRLYFDADSGKACFFVHGTDQTFGDPNLPILRDPTSLVGQAVMSNPVWKAEYLNRVGKIYDDVLKPIDWPARVNVVGEMVKRALAKHNPQWGKDYEPRIKEAHDRVANRIAAIGKQLEAMPRPMKLDPSGVVKVEPKGWHSEGTGAVMDEMALDGRQCLHIKATGDCAGSWRQSVNLPPGKYKMFAQIKTKGVVGTAGASGIGAGVRLSGGTRTGDDQVTGDVGWKEIAFEFDAPGSVILVAEMRANQGEAWFDKAGFRVEKSK